MRCPRRLTLHHHAQYSVDARLVALAMTLEPIEYVLIQTNGQLLFRRRPGQCRLFEKGLVEPRNVRIVNIRHPSYGQSRLARRRPDSRRDGGATKMVTSVPPAAEAVPYPKLESWRGKSKAPPCRKKRDKDGPPLSSFD